MAPPLASSSAQASHTLRDAFERFALSVSQDDRRLFSNTELKDVRDEALKIEKQLRKSRIQKNIARLDPLLRGMEHYSKVVEVLCNGTPYLSWVWAPIKLMLMITLDSLSAFEKLIDAYGKIGDMLPRLDRLSNALIGDQNFQKVLALVFADIVEFHRRAYKFVRRRSWAIFFGSMWAGFESRFNGLLKNLTYHSELVDKEASAADIAEAFRRSKINDEKWEQQEREWNSTVLGWLETSDTMPADILEHHLQDCLPNSCDWFVQHEETQLWLEDATKNPLLWLCGKPGAVFYYFCSSLRSNADGPITRPNRLLRSIISEVIQKHQDLAIYVHDVYFMAHPVPSKKALLNLLPELLRGLGSVRLIIDGIDEWVSRDQKDVLNDLSQIVSIDKSSHICKVLVASRETMEISRSLRRKNKSATTISLSNGDEDLAISRSIARFVESKLSDLPDHFDELDPDASIMAPEELRTIVDDLPSDLEKLYEKLFARLCSTPGSDSHGGVSRIMGLVCSARRPLHKSELLHALSISPRDTGSQLQSIPVAPILDHCKPLIEELLDSTIVPVHFSVKEYFLKSRNPQIIPANDAALDISSACAVVITRSLDLLCVNSGSVTDFARIVRSTRDGSSASDVNAPSFEEHGFARHGVLENMAPLGVPPQAKDKLKNKPGPSSYWSATELRDIGRHFAHFGTDFEAIAHHMGTKTGTMIKNQYLRLVESGQGAVEQRAKEADARRERGEDLGPPSTPTPAPERRYTDASPLPLSWEADSDDLNEGSEDEPPEFDGFYFHEHRGDE
ncbi:unnamed protein product [Alternaria alternata]